MLPQSAIETIDEDIIRRFTNHPPNGVIVTMVGDIIDTDVILDEITEQLLMVGKYLARTLPDGRERSLALTHLEQTSMWSKAAVARNQDKR